MLLPWLRKTAAQGAHIAGICTGVVYLAEAGLLDRRQATTHWAVADQFRQRYPKVDWRPEKFISEDRRMLCSGGVYASMDLSLYLVESLPPRGGVAMHQGAAHQHAATVSVGLCQAAAVASAQ
jgi:transcriptional regulator GlxA family with amidase domain